MKEFNLLKLYLVVISVVWLIWSVTWYGNFWYQMIKHTLITPEEYVIGSYDNYQVTQCRTENTTTIKNPTTPTTTGELAKPKTEAEILKCEETAKKNILARREFDYKDNLISWIVWWSLFLILFLTHFPVFYSKYRKES